MKCICCNTEYTGNFCPNCGTPAVAMQPTRKEGFLLGFRTHTGWKKFLAITYLVFLSFVATVVLASPREGQVTMYDFIVGKCFVATLFLAFFSPFIFLSNTKLRTKLPLFKYKKAGLSFVGMLIVIQTLFICAFIINNVFYSDEYMADRANHSYEVVSVEEASCTNDGAIKYECSYCGRSNTESIAATGHNMIEALRVEATCETAGSITYNCATCREEEFKELAALGHSFEELSRTEPTDTEDGEIHAKCKTCGMEKIDVIPCPIPWGTEDCPYIFTAQELFDLSADGLSQSKYQDKWVEVSGTILAISDYDSLKGYYLVGGAGAGVVCWIDSSTTDAQYGQTAVFIGKVTVADTKHIEIAECKIKDVQWPAEKQLSPVSICDWSHTINYFGGVEWNFRFKNNSEKTVKYITMEWNCYNAVDDLVYDNITGNCNFSITYTGPLSPGETSGSNCNTTLFYNHSYSYSKLTKLVIEFMDGTVVHIHDKGYYDYWIV